MPRQEKSPKKKSNKKLPKKSEEEDPAMDEADINRFLKNALDQANAKAEQKFKEQLKEAEDRLTIEGRVPSHDYILLSISLLVA